MNGAYERVFITELRGVAEEAEQAGLWVQVYQAKLSFKAGFLRPDYDSAAAAMLWSAGGGAHRQGWLPHSLPTRPVRQEVH